MRKKRKKLSRASLDRASLDRAILMLFAEDREVIPRTVMTHELYDYAWDLWAKSSAGRRELARRKRAVKGGA